MAQGVRSRGRGRDASVAFQVGNVGIVAYISSPSLSAPNQLSSLDLRIPYLMKRASVDRTTYDQAYVRSLFDRIAPRYDFLNHFLSSGFDVLWRKRAIRTLRDHHPRQILDVATGTADLAIEATSLRPEKIVGVDISTEMIRLGEEKIARSRLQSLITLERGSAEELPFPDGSFDAVMVAFGIRNFTNLEAGLAQMYRVLRPGGISMMLEFSRPRRTPLKQVYGFYFRRVLPVIGGLVSLNREAYDYLPKTVAQFPDGEELLAVLASIGYTRTRQQPLSGGIVTIYTGLKPK
jgi:demethylmenaquinone methyltransferase/2-methoxy-6-polyprenyl-1,4-benzoquinol methylase